jgi:LacI family transcriptional regulator
MSPIRQIVLAFPVLVGFEEEAVVGIEDYARRHGDWAILAGPSKSFPSVTQLKGWPGDGVIAMLATPDDARAARRLRVPLVDISAMLADTGLPRVLNDQQAIGRLAAGELLKCDVRHFACYGLRDAWFSEQRCQGFVGELADKGHSCAVLQTAGAFGSKGDWRGWQDELCRWLATIPRPFGLMAVDDVLARIVGDACRRLKLHVPHDVALIGVDNNRIVCETAQPTLSSVALNAREVGYRAAELLDALMSGRSAPKREILVAPTGVVARESTDRMAVGDPELGRAVRYIRQHIGEPFSMETLLRELGLSRRWLEYRFRQRYGRSPHAYICEARVERAKQLLRDVHEPSLDEIAKQCGLRRSRSLCVLFQRITGVTPSEYRRGFQV